MNISSLFQSPTLSLKFEVKQICVLFCPMILCFRVEIYFPSMQALAQQMDKEKEYEIVLSQSQSVLPPAGAAEVDVKTWQVLDVNQGYYHLLKLKLI